MKKEIKGYKAFDENLKCREKQYELNAEFSEDEAKVCSRGLHFCEYPLDVLGYYPAVGSRFAEVAGSGKADHSKDDDTKVCTTNLKIGAEISLHKLIEASVKFTFDRTKKTDTKSNDTDYGAASNSGYRGAASNSGNYGAASNSGNYGAASNSGNAGAAFTIGWLCRAETNAPESVAVAVGYENKARASLGSWIVLAERNGEGKILSIASKKVDGKEIKANTWYQLVLGKIVES